jgi:hypothetical protein
MKGATMTLAELEKIAREVRARGLHSSWNELLEFSETVVGSLVDAYQTLLRNSASSGSGPPANPSDLLVSLQEKLGKALVSLTSQEQVAKWESDALASNIPILPESLEEYG